MKAERKVEFPEILKLDFNRHLRKYKRTSEIYNVLDNMNRYNI